MTEQAPEVDFATKMAMFEASQKAWIKMNNAAESLGRVSCKFIEDGFPKHNRLFLKTLAQEYRAAEAEYTKASDLVLESAK